LIHEAVHPFQVQEYTPYTIISTEIYCLDPSSLDFSNLFSAQLAMLCLGGRRILMLVRAMTWCCYQAHVSLPHPPSILPYTWRTICGGSYIRKILPAKVIMPACTLASDDLSFRDHRFYSSPCSFDSHFNRIAHLYPSLVR